MRLKKNKKGIFFTLSAILLSALILLIISYQYDYQKQSVENTISYRITSMNNELNSIEKDLNREIYIAGFRTLLSMQKYIDEKGEFFNNSKGAFKEIIANGSYNNSTLPLMEETSLNDWTERVEKEVASTGINCTVEIKNISIEQNTPWTIRINVSIKVELKDEKLSVDMNHTSKGSSQISIIGFEDPLYTIYTYGRISNEIKKSNITTFVNNGNTTGLLSELNNGYYIASNNSPSYLMRLEGNLSPSKNGIESLVNITKLIDVGLTPKQKSVVDYIYFTNISTYDICVNNSKADPDLPNWFRLDQTYNHDKIYQINGISKNCS